MKEMEQKANLVAYGTFNVYEIDGKAYTKWKGRFIRTPERDFMIKTRQGHSTGVLE
jgi:uncharacterized protein YxjI